MKGDMCSHNGCNRIAIGYYSTSMLGLNVCIYHAPHILKAMTPGEQVRNDCNSYSRYLFSFEELKAKKKELFALNHLYRRPGLTREEIKEWAKTQVEDLEVMSLEAQRWHAGSE